MRTHNRDTETLIAALQSDLPTAEDDARMRALLASAGACIGASVVGTAALKTAGAAGIPSAALASGTLKGASAAASVKVGGVFSTLTAVLPFSGVKTLVVAGAIATGASYPVLAPRLEAVFKPVDTARPAVTQVEVALPVVEAKPHAVAAVSMAADNAQARASAVTPLESRGSAERVGSGMPPSVVTLNGRPESNSEVSVTGLRSASAAARTGMMGGASVTRRPDASGSDATSKPSTQLVQPPTEPEGGATGSVVSNVLADETLLIERALRAQRSGDAASARSWLAVHEQRFPNGKLTIERNRMRAQLQD